MHFPPGVSWKEPIQFIIRLLPSSVYVLNKSAIRPNDRLKHLFFGINDLASSVPNASCLLSSRRSHLVHQHNRIPAERRPWKVTAGSGRHRKQWPDWGSPRQPRSAVKRERSRVRYLKAPALVYSSNYGESWVLMEDRWPFVVVIIMQIACSSPRQFPFFWPSFFIVTRKAEPVVSSWQIVDVVVEFYDTLWRIIMNVL